VPAHATANLEDHGLRLRLALSLRLSSEPDATSNHDAVRIAFETSSAHESCREDEGTATGGKCVLSTVDVRLNHDIRF
jgi:hypothetical protein